MVSRRFAICLLVILSGCMAAPEEAPAVSDPGAADPDCKALHAPPLTPGITNPQLLWFTGQPGPNHQLEWVDTAEKNRLDNFRAARLAYPSIENSYNFALTQMFQWERDTTSPPDRRTAMKDRYARDKDKLLEQLKACCLAMGITFEEPGPVPYTERSER